MVDTPSTAPWGQQQTPEGLDHQQIARFFHLLQRDPATVRLRMIRPAGHPEGSASRKLPPGPDQLDQAEELNREGWNAYAVINPGGDSKDSITAGVALFCEWDDRPKDQQRTAWQGLGLPPPTCQVDTGGKSIHTYWTLTEPIDPRRWEQLQRRLIQHAGSDPAIKDRPRVMRLPGANYWPKGGGPSTTCSQLIEGSGKPCPVEELEQALPALQQVIPADSAPPDPTGPSLAPGAAGAGGAEWRGPQRSMAEIIAALDCILPRFRAGCGNYPRDRNVLWSLIKAIQEAPDGIQDREGAIQKAVELVEAAGWTGWDAQQIAGSGGDHVNAGTFWHHARENGYNLERGRRVTEPTPPPEILQQQQATPNGNGRTPLQVIPGGRQKASAGAAPDHWGAPSPDDLADAEGDAENRREERDRFNAARQQSGDILHVLPPSLADLLTRKAAAFPVAPEAMLPPLLCIVASIYGRRGKVHIKEGHDEPLILWIGTVAEPSAMKTPVSSALLGPLKAIYEDERARHETELQQVRASNERLQEERKDLLKGKKRADLTDEQRQQLDDIDSKRVEEPELRELFVGSDITFQQLGMICQRKAVRGLVATHDELENWLRDFDRDPSLRSRWLSLWSGGLIKQDYKQAESCYASETCVSVFGNTTPDNITERVQRENERAAEGERSSGTGDGLWPRLLWCQPPHVEPRYNIAEVGIGAELRNLYEQTDSITEGPIKLQPEARDRLIEVHDQLVEDAEGSAPVRQVFIGKLRGYLWRFAGLLSVVDRAWSLADRGEGQPFYGVTLEQAKRAERLTHYFLGQFDRLAPLMGQTSLPEWVPRLQAYGERHPSGLTPRDYSRSQRGLTCKEARHRLRTMVEVYGFGELEELKQGGLRWIPAKA